MTRALDLSGQQFGRLTVIERSVNTPQGKPQWNCQCKCGNGHLASTSNLRQGRVRSCGCLAVDCGRRHAPLAAAALIKHAQSNSRLNAIFKGMQQRCYNKNRPAFKHYGGRGITIDEAWLSNRASFFEWATANGYAKGLSIDRINNDKGYTPDNCHWVSATTQNNNTRRNVLLAYDGRSLTVAQWATELGIPSKTLWARFKSGWSACRALTTPVNRNGDAA